VFGPYLDFTAVLKYRVGSFVVKVALGRDEETGTLLHAMTKYPDRIRVNAVSWSSEH
jgi:hypothetical protein